MVEVDYDHLEATLCNRSGKTPLAERFRSLFTLKNIADSRSIDIIAKGELKVGRYQGCNLLKPDIVALSDESALLKHELAYCLGQIGNPSANDVLSRVLGDMNEDEMVRHEVYTVTHKDIELKSTNQT